MRKLISVCLMALALAHAPATRAQSSANYALAFNSGAFVSIPNFGAIAPTNEVTVEFWVNMSGPQQSSAFMLQPDDGTNRFQCHPVYPNGNLYWDFGNINTQGRLFTLVPFFPFGGWTHVALVASHSGNFMAVYFNGSLVANTGAMTPFVRGNYELNIGGNTNFYFNGILDDFRVWNVALTQTQIRSNMNTVLTGSEPNLLLYYRFDEGSGTVASNSATLTGAAYNGTLVNGPVWFPSGAILSPYAPVVTTLAPTTDAGTNATFAASVNPEGAAATYYFEYGTTASYGSFSATNTLPATNAFLNVGILVGELQPLSSYHYRIVAANSLGTNYGGDLSFTTASAFIPVAPAGARIFQQSVSNAIVNPGQGNVYTLPLTAGQNLSLLITPAPGFWPSVQLTDPSGSPFGSAAAPAAGEMVLLNNSPILLSGNYSLSISGVNGSTGGYSVKMVLNAALEAESYLDEPNNDLFAAENLFPSAFPAGTGNGEEMAVVGNLAGRPSLSWPDPGDFYRFFLNQGETATLVAKNLTAGQLQLQLQNGSGQTLAFGGSGASNVSQYIDGFVAPSSDYYYAVVTGNSNVQYSLVVTRNAEFNLEPNDLTYPGQSPYGLQTLIGHMGTNTSDYYYAAANVGDHLHFSTATPSSGPLEIQNGLYPELLLYDANANLVAIANGNASDGRNSVIDFTVPSGDAGSWTIQVTTSPSLPESVPGDYQLTVQGATGGLSPFAVIGSLPAAGANVAPAATITLQFNQQVYGPSLTPGELKVNGVAATAVTLTGPDSATWTIPAGAYGTGTNLFNVASLVIDQNSHQVTSVNGATSIPFSYTFRTSTGLTPPTAAPDSVTDMENTLTNIPASFLLSNDSNPITGPLSLTGVNGTNGATVVLTNGGATIAYTPPPGFAGVDSFNYTLSNGHLTATGLVTVFVSRTGAPLFNHLAISGNPADLSFSFSGFPGQQYALMYSTSVTGPWTELYPALVTDMGGFAQYTNITASPPPVRFFRAQPLPW